MRLLRSMVYRLGFRPRFGTLLYSPTKHLETAMRGFRQAFLRGLREGRPDR